MTERPYHHGDLKNALLAAAVEAIAQHGPAALSLRDLARRAGVSHAAPAHHFGDKAGLLTELATEGYDLMAEAVRSAGPDLVEAGVGYVRFAVEHRSHFEVMFQPALLHPDDPGLVAARARADAALSAALAASRPERAEQREAKLAAWSLAHGFAALWVNGAMPDLVDRDPAGVARPVLRNLFGG
ncbi:TetR/AcrR family transcriptional regulator [Streptomyces bambusae]|uniref:TetR/AcrR family transcriptional regulator n=1 Tax=Streptomyces bambusae TaxID=1550616 RepID=UPI001CFC4EB8|nr:TetR/AcrR family transcriptional regulator [Streptomyces bambusae]MCB5165807.1 TetR/AcrR family transcriptional regulator [Streptomyces bambusae]